MEHKGSYGDDKFYLRPTNHVTVHGGAIPIQQPPQVTFKLHYLYFLLIFLWDVRNRKIANEN